MERPEHHFPQLEEIILFLDENAPELLTDKLALEEAEFNQKIAAADKGLKVGLRLSGHSIQEDRPSRDFDQRYKAFSSIYVKSPSIIGVHLRPRKTSFASIKIKPD